MEIKALEFQKRVEVFFCNPSINENDYYNLYRTNFPGEEPPAYSPLYRLRRELFSHYCNERWLSAMLFPSIIIGGLARYIFSSGDTSKETVENFIKKYFDFSELEMGLTRLYRNTQEHNFGFLLDRVEKNNKHTGRYFEQIKDSLVNRGERVGSGISTFKVHFPLSTRFEEIVRIANTNQRGGYILVDVEINPKKYIDRMERAISLFCEDVNSSQVLQERFMASMTRDNWMRVYES